MASILIRESKYSPEKVGLTDLLSFPIFDWDFHNFKKRKYRYELINIKSSVNFFNAAFLHIILSLSYSLFLERIGKTI